ncbi:pentapeptide repeat-containing protein [Siculibacillus lacustris]|nr:pentapeptide repeat-containing protein [Siculibacillus lacustris]
MAADTEDLEGLLGSVNRSAERLQTLWFSFIGLTLYVIITALTTTHMNLLLNEAQVLPILSMTVPLLPFYVIAPLFYVVIHFYVLLMLTLLAGSAKVFEDALRRAIPIESERETFRARIENALFLQLLVGAAPERNGVKGRLLAAMALITIAVAPVLTLIALQTQFLPYHHFAITWLHRALVGLDLVLVLVMWRAYRVRWGALPPPGPITLWRRRGVGWWRRHLVGLVARSLGPLLVIWLTLGEGRWAGEPYLDPTDGLDGEILANLGLESLVPNWSRDGIAPRYQFSYNFTRFGLRPLVWTGLISDRLDVSGETIVGADLIDKADRERKSFAEAERYVRTRDFRGRDFTMADFSAADIRGADFSGGRTILRRANLMKASLQGANLSMAQIRGSTLLAAEMQGANLFSAEMQEAVLATAQLQGAELSSANLRGADLSLANMQGANLSAVQMQGANLSAVQMQGADLSSAEMQGAKLSWAQMQGTNLREANLQATDLKYASICGSILEGSQLSNADLSYARIFRNHSGLSSSPARIIAINTDRFFTRRIEPNSDPAGFPSEIFEAMPNGFHLSNEELTDKQIEAWRKAATEHVRAYSLRAEIGARFDWLMGDRATEDEANAAFWKEAERTSAQTFPTAAFYVAHLMEALEKIACDANGDFHEDRRYVANGILTSHVDTLIAAGFDTILERLRALRRDPKTCPGLASINEDDWSYAIRSVLQFREFKAAHPGVDDFLSSAPFAD